MRIEHNTVVHRNAALRALVVLALFECSGFITVRFGTNGIFCKKIVVIQCARAMYTAPVRVHGPYTAVYTGVHGRVHGPYTAVYRFVDMGRVHDRVHGLSYARHVHGRVHGPTRPVHGPFTAVYTCIRVPPLQVRVSAMYTAV